MYRQVREQRGCRSVHHKRVTFNIMRFGLIRSQAMRRWIRPVGASLSSSILSSLFFLERSSKDFAIATRGRTAERACVCAISYRLTRRQKLRSDYLLKDMPASQGPVGLSGSQRYNLQFTNYLRPRSGLVGMLNRLAKRPCR